MPIALHCPVIDIGPVPGRPIWPRMAARVLINVTVSVPCTEWLTPIVQAMHSRSAPAIASAAASKVASSIPHAAAVAARVLGAT